MLTECVALCVWLKTRGRTVCVAKECVAHCVCDSRMCGALCVWLKTVWRSLSHAMRLSLCIKLARLTECVALCVWQKNVWRTVCVTAGCAAHCACASRLCGAAYRIQRHTVVSHTRRLCGALHVIGALYMISRAYPVTYYAPMEWLWLVGSIKWWVTFAKEPYTRDDILQKRPII